MIEWFTFSCTGCGARIILDKDIAPIHCGTASERVDGMRADGQYSINGLVIETGSSMRGLLDGTEPGSSRPLVVVTVASCGGLIQLTRAEYQTLVEVSMHDLLHRGPTWEIVNGALARLQRMLLSRIEIGSIRREVDKLSSILGETKQ